MAEERKQKLDFKTRRAAFLAEITGGRPEQITKVGDKLYVGEQGFVDFNFQPPPPWPLPNKREQ